MIILKATPSDFDKIAPLFDLYRQFYGRPADLEAAKHFLQERLTNTESVIFYARDAGKAIGFVQLYPSFSSISMKRLWILNDLFVMTSARRKKVGRQLLEKATEFAKETNAKGLSLKTAVDNLSAQLLYESLGWKRDGRFYSYDLSVDLTSE